MHVDVVGGVRAHRLAARAVHRVGSDDVTSQAAGFRRTAQSSAHARATATTRVARRRGDRAVARRGLRGGARVRRWQQLRRDVEGGHASARSKSGLRCESGLRSSGPVVLRATAGRAGVVSRSWTHWATSRDLVSLMVPAHDAGTGLDGSCPRRGAARRSVRPRSVRRVRRGFGVQSERDRRGLDRCGQEHRREDDAGPRPRAWSSSGHHRSEGRVRRAGVGPMASTSSRSVATAGAAPFRRTTVRVETCLRALIASAQGASLKSDQHYVIDEVWQRTGRAAADAACCARSSRYCDAHLTSAAATPERSLALTLYRFIHGDLAGLFDGDGDPMVFDGPTRRPRPLVAVVVELVLRSPR